MGMGCIPIGSIVVPFRGLHVGSQKVIPNRNYYGASEYTVKDSGLRKLWRPLVFESSFVGEVLLVLKVKVSDGVTLKCVIACFANMPIQLNLQSFIHTQICIQNIM